MTRLEKKLLEDAPLWKTKTAEEVAKLHADTAMTFIRKAFEAGRLSAHDANAPGLDQWLDEQKLR